MAKRSICIHCGLRKGKRMCPALDGMICSSCCGQHRIVEIDCPDCPHLGNEEYQVDRRRNNELAEAMQAVNPDVIGKEVLAASEGASRFAHSLEMSFGMNAIGDELKDRDVKEALKAAYYRFYKEEDYAVRSDFVRTFLDYMQTDLIPEFQGSLSRQLQEQILLRLMLSVRNMTGGNMGDCGYLNYVKNNILSTPPDGRFVVETAKGHKMLLKTGK